MAHVYALAITAELRLGLGMHRELLPERSWIPPWTTTATTTSASITRGRSEVRCNSQAGRRPACPARGRGLPRVRSHRSVHIQKFVK